MAQEESINIRKQYFKSWASYQIPIRPTQPISYHETESLISYYLGDYDEGGQLVRFTKFLRKSTPDGAVPIKGGHPIGGVLYFSAEPHGQMGYSVGDPLTFEKTANLTVYYKGNVKPGDQMAKLELIQTELFFVDDYSYWPNGHLKSRTMQKYTGEVQHKYYDEIGHETQPMPTN